MRPCRARERTRWCTRWERRSRRSQSCQSLCSVLIPARLLRDLRDLESLRLLRGVGVIRACVHLEVVQLLSGKLVLGKHALDGVLDDARGVLLNELTDRNGAEAARVA